MIHDQTTITAIATPGGGALAIIRISGPDAWEICSRITLFPSSKKALPELKANTLHFANIVKNDEVVDEVVLSLFRGPKSYTGEDMIEISCHGSPYIQKRILELLMEEGAVLAKPGEFTQRAFLNGKMDLSQAEAVADLIASGSKAAHKIAMDQMRGGFSNELKKLRAELLNFASLIELELDFSEEDVEFANRDEFKKLTDRLAGIFDKLISSFSLGNVIKQGVPVAIVGKPNVGKSTLLNRLLNEEKAIVSEIAGTTRDVIEDTIIIEGITFRFIDTAGIRETADTIETLGIRKTYQKIGQAKIVLLLADARDDQEIILRSLDEIRKQVDEDKHLILLINKADLAGEEKLRKLKESLHIEKDEKSLFLSAEKDPDLLPLHDLLVDAARLSDIKDTDIIISNARHYEALSHARDSLRRVSEGLETGLSEDLLAQDIRLVLHYLGEITGEITTDEILGNIFRNFCIGK